MTGAPSSRDLEQDRGGDQWRPELCDLPQHGCAGGLVEGGIGNCLGPAEFGARGRHGRVILTLHCRLQRIPDVCPGEVLSGDC